MDEIKFVNLNCIDLAPDFSHQGRIRDRQTRESEVQIFIESVSEFEIFNVSEAVPEVFEHASVRVQNISYPKSCRSIPALNMRLTEYNLYLLTYVGGENC